MGETIKALRERHKYSQSYLASCLEISRQMYIKYESGEVEPPVRVIVALARLYRVPYSALIDDTLNPHKENVSYKIDRQTHCQVASPAATYGSHKKNTTSQLSLLVASLQTMSQESLASVCAFVKMLQSEQITAKQAKSKSKKAFFDLAGKVRLDSAAVTEFREASLV